MISSLLTFVDNLIHIYIWGVSCVGQNKEKVLTFTIIIERKRTYTMFNIFRMKNKIEIQLDEYVEFKSKTSSYIARDQKEVLDKFIKHMKYKTIGEITMSSISSYYTVLDKENTRFFRIKAMQAIRAFIRFHRHQTNLFPDKITDHGVVDTEDVGRSVVEIQQVARKLGRPKNLELVKKIKRLRDNEGLSFRAIAKALGKDVKNIHIMYKYDI